MRVMQLLAIACLFGLFTGSHAYAQDLPRVSLQTNLGTIVLELDQQRAPTSVENFVGYVNSGFYNDTLFHRVIDGFMVQGGGFSPKLMRKQTRSPIRNEANNGLKNRAYTISMARTNSPHSATSQFFINTVDNPNLDHTAATSRGWGYAVFGRVIDGFDVVDQIGSVQTGAAGPFPRDVPKEAIVIESASVIGRDESAATSAATSAASTAISEAKETGEEAISDTQQ